MEAWWVGECGRWLVMHWWCICDAFVARRRWNEVRGAQRLVWVCDDLVVVRHHGSVSGMTWLWEWVSEWVLVRRLGGSTTPWECSQGWHGWESVWERRQCESRLGGSTTPWKWEQTLSQNTSDVRSLSVVTQVRRMWECVWWHSMWDGECEKTSDGCEHSEKWGERERGDEWVSVRRVVWVSSQGWRWVWEHSVWEHSCEWVVVGVMWEHWVWDEW